jgi:N-acyl homoserine lactone hydrolase
VRSFTPATLSVPVEAPVAVPAPAHPPAAMRVLPFISGSMSSGAAFAFRGGSLREEREFTMGGVLVQHPKGSLLFDTGFGRQVRAHIADVPWPMRVSSKFTVGQPIVDQMKKAGIDPRSLTAVVPTHVHWDHVSGVPDFPKVPVWLPESEATFVREGGFASKLMRSFSPEVRTFGFAHGPYLGYPHSYDVFADGSVVLVEASGHTPGSIIAFITEPSGRKLALIGDLAWQQEGYEEPCERPWLTRTLADDHPEAVRAQLVRLYRLHKQFPDMLIVPAHEPRAWAKLAQ